MFCWIYLAALQQLDIKGQRVQKGVRITVGISLVECFFFMFA